MKRVIKNKKKMKNTMYIVFGVFALALFGITMLNPSHAEEGLIIDEALDAIMQGTEIYGSGGFEKVEEEKLIQPVEDHEGEDEDIVEPEVTSDEEIEEGEGEDSQDLEDVDLEGSGEDVKENADETVEDKGQKEDKGINGGDDMDEESHGVNNENDGFNIVNFDKLEKNTIQQYEDDEIGQELTSGCFKGKTLGSGKVEITSYDSTTCGLDNVVIPETIEGRTVTAIGENVFENVYGNKGIKSVNIPDTVEVIGMRAFYHSNFSSDFVLKLPRNLKTIGNYAFETSNISGFDGFPNGLEYIGEYAFSNFTRSNTYNHLHEVIIPNSVKYIGQYAFNGNPISKLVIGNSVEEIGDYAFQDAGYNRESPTFDEIIIPDSVKKIGMSAFQANKSLKRVYIGSGVGSLELWPDVFGGCSISDFILNKESIHLMAANSYRSSNYNPYENVIITVNEVTRNKNGIGLLTSNKNGVFANLTLNTPSNNGVLNTNWRGQIYLKTLTLDPSIHTIDNGIFQYSYSNKLTIPGAIKTIGSGVFEGFSVTLAGKDADLIIEEGVEIIGTGAFKSNYSLGSISLPNTLKEIGNEAFFWSCQHLTELNIPGSVKKIGKNAFNNCTRLENLTLNEGLEEIGTGAFQEIFSYSSADSIVIPDSVKFIGKNAFYGGCRSRNNNVCQSKKKVTVYVANDIIPEIEDPETVEYIRRYKIDFTGNSNLIIYPERQIVDLNEVAVDPNTPEIEGYTFGWYKQGENVPYDFSTPITENIVLEARLTKNNYKVIYKDNNGNLIEEKMVEFESKIPTPTPTKQGYIFKGWAGLTENGNMPAHDIVLTANWEEEPSRSSGGGGRKSTPASSEMNKPAEATAEIAIENEHNSATDDEKGVSDIDKTSLNEKTSKEVISVTQETAEDGTEVEVVVEAVAIKNTNIVATVRTETPVNGTNSSSSSSSTHTKEQADAYSFAKSNGITTTESIEQAKMNTELTRIQMAKMLSNYAINVLGIEPDPEKGIVKFNDVTNKMDKQYDNAVTKAYQLGIMGQNVKNNEFRPNDEVTRAEFASALSRLLYQTEEGEYKGTGKYYVPHVAKLYNEGIINKADPKIKEKRGYVMTMLMRTVK